VVALWVAHEPGSRLGVNPNTRKCGILGAVREPLPPQSARQRIGANSTASPKRSGPSGNRGLNALLTAAVWALMVPAAVDFSSLMGPDLGPGVAVAAARNYTKPGDSNPEDFPHRDRHVGDRVARRSSWRTSQAHQYLFVLFLLLMFASIVWSADSGATLARCVSYSTTVLVVLRLLP